MWAFYLHFPRLVRLFPHTHFSYIHGRAGGRAIRRRRRDLHRPTGDPRKHGDSERGWSMHSLTWMGVVWCRRGKRVQKYRKWRDDEGGWGGGSEPPEPMLRPSVSFHIQKKGRTAGETTRSERRDATGIGGSHSLDAALLHYHGPIKQSEGGLCVRAPSCGTAPRCSCFVWASSSQLVSPKLVVQNEKRWERGLRRPGEPEEPEPSLWGRGPEPHHYHCLSFTIWTFSGCSPTIIKKYFKNFTFSLIFLTFLQNFCLIFLPIIATCTSELKLYNFCESI